MHAARRGKITSFKITLVLHYTRRAVRKRQVDIWLNVQSIHTAVLMFSKTQFRRTRLTNCSHAQVVKSQRSSRTDPLATVRDAPGFPEHEIRLEKHPPEPKSSVPALC